MPATRWIDTLGPYSESRCRRAGSPRAWRHDRPPDTRGRAHLVLPETRLSLVVESRRDARGELDRSAWLFGPIRTPRRYDPDRGVRLEGVFVLPEFAGAALGVAPAEIVDAIIPLAGLSSFRAIEAALLDDDGDALERTLVERAADRACPRAQAAARALRATAGQVSLERLAARLGMGARHFRRRFSDVVGMGPKQFARHLRCQAAIEAADRVARPDWADLAPAFGYADQAHLCREVRAFTGASPGRLHADRRAESDFFKIA